MNLLVVLLCALLAPLAIAGQSSPHLDLEATLDVRARTLNVTATIQVMPDSTPVEFELTDASGIGVEQLKFEPASHRQSRQFRYRVALSPLAEIDHRETLVDQSARVDARGSFIPAASRWYPSPREGLFTYRVKLFTSADQRALVPGRLEHEALDATTYTATFVFDAPAQSIDLMAGPYRIEERMASNGVRLRTYFHAELSALSPGYLDSAAAFIERYAAAIGPYPFSEFSIVSSPTPTGFGMPTLTYLGVDVLRLPFIRHTSLGHEVLHNWWGNGVYVNYESGNWCEGLTAFMSDYAFKEHEGEAAARAARLTWLRELSALPESADNALRKFRARTHGASQIVGYSKAAMVFYMLRERLGARAFSQGLRHFWSTHRFKSAGWNELQASFEKSSSVALGDFFSQWLDRSDLAKPRVSRTRVAGPQSLEIRLRQDTPPYDLVLPIVLHTDAATTRTSLPMRTTDEVHLVPAANAIRRVVLDPDLQVLRKLDDAEVPAILRQVMIARNVHLHVPDTDSAFTNAALDLAKLMLDDAPVVADAPEHISAPLILIGTHARVDAVLERLSMRRPTEVLDRGTSQVWAARRTNGAIALVISTADLSSLKALLRPLPHYGSQSYLVFDGSKAIQRGLWPYTPIELVPE